MIGVFVIRIVNVIFFQTEFINIGIMMIMVYAVLAGIVYSFVDNKENNINKLFVSLPLKLKEI